MEPFYQPPTRGARGHERFPFHIKLTAPERAKLAKLSKKLKMTAADVIRQLLKAA